MTFEIYRCGTLFCWRLLSAKGALLCEGKGHRRLRAEVEEEIFQLMDQVPNAHIVDKTKTTESSVTADIKATAKRARAVT